MKHILFFLSLFLVSNILVSQNLHSDSIDVINYNIQIKNIDFDDNSIIAQTDLKIVPKQENTTHFSLDLLQLTCDSIKLNDVNLDFAHNDTVLNIFLEQTPTKNYDTLLLSVYYHGNPVIGTDGWGGVYFNNQYCYNLGVSLYDIPHNYGRVWFPCIDDFIDRATYDFSITTKNHNRATCNGLLTNIDTIVNGSDTSLIHHWHMSDEIPTYLASFAVGPYDLVEWTYEGLERDIPVQLFVYSGDSAQAINTFANLDSILTVYETLYSPYPWQRIGYVAVPFSNGAMEHTTNIAIPAAIIDGTTTYEGLIAHELSHHWFGDYITCHDAEEMWINEGWATYSETIHKEFLYGKESAKNYRRTAHKNVLLSGQYDDGGWYSLNDVPQETTYGATSYEKGASVVHSLRDYLGDTLFFNAIHDMLDEKALQDISSEEMRDIMSNSSQIDLNDFFDNWVFQKGFPHYKLDSFNVVSQGSEFDVDVWVKQQLYGRDNLSNGNIVNVCFVNDEFEITEKRLYFDGEFGYQNFTIDFNPKFVLIDINEKCSDAKTSKYKFINSTGTHSFSNELFKGLVSEINDSTFLYVSHHLGAPDTIKNPIEGLILAQNRYWKIAGNFPEDLKIKGEFYYSNNTSGSMPYLDTEFITNSLDSIRLMYRTTPQEDWAIIAGQTNSSFMKKISIDTLKSGEYALAIYDWSLYQGINNKHIDLEISVYPNPSSEGVFIQTEKNLSGTCDIFDSSGKPVFSLKFKNQIEPIFWPGNEKPGVYFMKITSTLGVSNVQKIILQ